MVNSPIRGFNSAGFMHQLHEIPKDQLHASISNSKHLSKTCHAHVGMNVVDLLADKGYVPVRQTFKNSRIEDPEFSTHMLWFVPKTATGMVNKKDIELPSFVYQGGNNLRTKSKLAGGKLRQVCGNGLICLDVSDFHSISHRRPELEVIQTITQIEDEISTFGKLIEIMKTKEITKQKAKFLTGKILKTLNMSDRIDTNDLLKPIRPEDEQMTYWHVGNIVQEKLVNGGVKVTPIEKDGKERTTQGTETGRGFMKRTNVVMGTFMRDLKLIK